MVAGETVINLMVALAVEAKPLVAAYGLSSEHARGPFRVFRGERMALVVSGVGKVAAGAACACHIIRASNTMTAVNPRNAATL